ncbi:hypothetical protein MLD38_032202 [Melastoma candidum]|uniref:Uncharacterized protein n=1 Tax=Melastoma candidum TaxID=119954 RepID=A0ACB9M4R8_9MYRT|nr:hypothetical protein MLD38_032202 [Melastoma candidum]
MGRQKILRINPPQKKKFRIFIFICSPEISYFAGFLPKFHLFQGYSCRLDMAESKGSAGLRSAVHLGKHASLPPRIPFPSVSSAYVDYVPATVIGSRVVQKPRDNFTHHQRTSSESLIFEEQPSWLDDLLNEPETSVRRGGHRRSSSDSFAYVDTGNLYSVQDDLTTKGRMPITSWGSQESNHYQDGWKGSLLPEVNPFKPKGKPWETPLNRVTHSRDRNIVIPSSRPVGIAQETDKGASALTDKHYQVDSCPDDSKLSSDRKDISLAKQPSETETKRAKQQFAQRSRVRKLQYIAELEKNVQALQAEGSEVSAELEFLNQQNLILSMENKSLKLRLENLAQEQMIKYLEHEVLERELGRLRALHQQQQNPPQQQPQQKQPSSSLRRSPNRDLEMQFGNLSLKHKEPSSGQDSVSGPLHTTQPLNSQ